MSRTTKVSSSGALVAKDGGSVIGERWAGCTTAASMCGGGWQGAGAHPAWRALRAHQGDTVASVTAGLACLTRLHHPPITPLLAGVGQALSASQLSEVALRLAPSNVSHAHSITVQLPGGGGFVWHRVRWQGQPTPELQCG